MTRKLYVANIPFRSNERDLEDLFASYGPVNYVKLIYGDRGHKGFGFIEMSDEDTAKKALDGLNGTDFMERPLIVDFARERTNRPSYQRTNYDRPYERSYRQAY